MGLSIAAEPSGAAAEIVRCPRGLDEADASAGRRRYAGAPAVPVPAEGETITGRYSSWRGGAS